MRPNSDKWIPLDAHECNMEIPYKIESSPASGQMGELNKFHLFCFESHERANRLTVMFLVLESRLCVPHIMWASSGYSHIWQTCDIVIRLRVPALLKCPKSTDTHTDGRLPDECCDVVASTISRESMGTSRCRRLRRRTLLLSSVPHASRSTIQLHSSVTLVLNVVHLCNKK